VVQADPQSDEIPYLHPPYLSHFSLVHSSWRAPAQALMVARLSLYSGAMITKLLAGGLLDRHQARCVSLTSGQKAKASRQWRAGRAGRRAELTTATLSHAAR